ncbi:flavodoxin family protein [Clostridium saccharoperbutylacetonicum]|uniref:flavodoxin family protein n=1 Tax=Clostridium saccharoperbutylacetonicum TaxID=36745 RepID=UPI0028BE8AE2|nr:flavodoxin [Clostridium saccharoperbutylacetonicum]NSB25548.1 flavodoxin [Clostridium saccharoperbutylacetonicum]
MKKLVIYYSHDGNTKFIAETIAREINADITELKTKKTMNASGLMKVGWGVRQLVSQSEPILLTMEKNPADYDLIIIGSPVWTYTFAPPIRTFFKKHSMVGKKLGSFVAMVDRREEH